MNTYECTLNTYEKKHNLGNYLFDFRTFISIFIYLPPCGSSRALEPICCKKQKKKFLTSYWFVE